MNLRISGEIFACEKLSWCWFVFFCCCCVLFWLFVFLQFKDFSFYDALSVALQLLIVSLQALSFFRLYSAFFQSFLTVLWFLDLWWSYWCCSAFSRRETFCVFLKVRCHQMGRVFKNLQEEVEQNACPTFFGWYFWFYFSDCWFLWQYLIFCNCLTWWTCIYWL